MAAGKEGRLNFVCVDGSEFSENVFDWYVSNYHQPEDCVGLVHVHQMPSLTSLSLLVDGVPITDEYHKSIGYSIRKAKTIQSKFEELCQNKGLKFQFFMADAHHSPGHVICDLAKERKADTITMGQRGLGAISRTLLGSTSDYVLHHAHIPVTIVPPARKQ